MGKSPRREQPGITVTRSVEQASPRTSWPWRSHLPTQQASLGNPASLGRKLKPEAKGFVAKRHLAGWAAVSGRPGWGGTQERRRVAMPWQVGLTQPTLQLGLSAGLPSGLSLTRHSLDLKLARDLQLGMEAREPQRPSMEGVGSFPGERGWVRPGQPVCLGQALGSDYPPPGDASFPQHLPFP